MRVIIENGIGIREAERRLAAGDRSPELEPFMIDGEFHNIAEERLKKGFEACYVDLDLPGELVVEKPDGSRQVVGVDNAGIQFKVRDIPPVDPPRHWLK